MRSADGSQPVQTSGRIGVPSGRSEAPDCGGPSPNTAREVTMRLPFGRHRTANVVFANLLIAVAALTTANMTGASQSPAADQDPVLGQWRLDVSKSKYTPGPGPKSETRTYRSTDEGVRAVIVRTHQNGRVETIEYGADYDSVNHVIGTPDYDAVQLTRITAYVSEAKIGRAHV